MSDHQHIHPSCVDANQLLKDCKVVRTRGSGPGGQHRNKVETAIVITHQPSGITGQASERRSQAENQKLAVLRLRINLAIGVRSATGPAPSSLWLSRLQAEKISVSENHEDFPCLLAEALSHLFEREFDAAKTAEVLKCSSSQLIKFLKKAPEAFELLNRKRTEQGKSKYR